MTLNKQLERKIIEIQLKNRERDVEETLRTFRSKIRQECKMFNGYLLGITDDKRVLLKYKIEDEIKLTISDELISFIIKEKERFDRFYTFLYYWKRLVYEYYWIKFNNEHCEEIVNKLDIKQFFKEYNDNELQ